MHEAARHVVGASIEAARQVWTGQVDHAANIAGGLHHAMPDRASGFCVYNDVAVAIRWLLDNGAEKVAYVDVDVHHGDGVEHVFYDDPRVLTISLHETGQMLFPGTGFPADSGGPEALGSAVNVALPPGTSDAGWLRAFHAVVPTLRARVRARRAGHPARLRQPPRRPAGAPRAQRRRPAGELPRPARPRPRGRRRPLGGPRRGRLLGDRRGAAGLVAPARRRGGHAAGPRSRRRQSWREEVSERLGVRTPLRMTDGRTPAYRDWSEGYDPDTWLDRADRRPPGTKCSPTTAWIRIFESSTEQLVASGHADVSRFTLANLWNIGHIWPYISHQTRTWGLRWGSRGRAREKERCAMAEHPRDISEVKFLTVAEVAAVMRVSKMTVYRLVHNGELPAVRVGRSFRVSEDDVNEYLKNSFFDAG